MKRKIILVLICMLLLCSYSFAWMTMEELEAEIDEVYENDGRLGCQPTKVEIIDDGGDFYVYKCYFHCTGHPNCNRKAFSQWKVNNGRNGGKLGNVRATITPLNNDERFLFEEGEVIKKDEDYKLESAGLVFKGDTQNASDFDYDIPEGAAYSIYEYDKDLWDSEDRTYYNYEEQDMFTSEIEESLVLINEEGIFSESDDGDMIQLPEVVGVYNLSYEVINVIKEFEIYREREKDRDGEWEEWSEWEFYVEPDDVDAELELEAISEVPIYVGPYPTLQCKSTITDRDEYSHEDTVRIDGIRMTCTYKPKQLKFELYDKDGNCTELGRISSANMVITPRADGLGHNVTCPAIEKTLNFNIDPTKDYYLKVLIEDESTEASSGDFKYVKFGTVYF